MHSTECPNGTQSYATQWCCILIMALKADDLKDITILHKEKWSPIRNRSLPLTDWVTLDKSLNSLILSFFIWKWVAEPLPFVVRTEQSKRVKHQVEDWSRVCVSD